MFRKEEQKSLNPTPRPNTRGVKEKNSQYFERAISLADTRESKFWWEQVVRTRTLRMEEILLMLDYVLLCTGGGFGESWRARR